MEIYLLEDLTINYHFVFSMDNFWDFWENCIVSKQTIDTKAKKQLFYQSQPKCYDLHKYCIKSLKLIIRARPYKKSA